MATVSFFARRWSAVILLLCLAGISETLFAQTNDVRESAGGTQILFLGTSGGPPLRLERSEPSTLLTVDGHQYLIDCGIGTMRRMLQAGIQSEQIKTIFFTHLHSDHDLGLADVMANDFLRLGLADADHRINIYGPPQTKELVDAAFHYITISVRPFAAENPRTYRITNGEFVSPFVAHEIEHEGVIFQDDKIRVIAAENTHYALIPPQDRTQLKSYSYRIETPRGAIVFTGDTGPNSETVIRLAKGADVLVAEASSRDPGDLNRFVNLMGARNHWSADRVKAFREHFQSGHLDSNSVGQLATKAQVKSVVLYHYNPLDKSDQAAYMSGVKKYFSGPVFGPDDLDRYCLDARANGGTASPLHPCGNAALKASPQTH